VARVDQIWYRTRTRETRLSGTAGLPVPVLYPIHTPLSWPRSPTLSPSHPHYWGSPSAGVRSVPAASPHRPAPSPLPSPPLNHYLSPPYQPVTSPLGEEEVLGSPPGVEDEDSDKENVAPLPQSPPSPTPSTNGGWGNTPESGWWPSRARASTTTLVDSLPPRVSSPSPSQAVPARIPPPFHHIPSCFNCGEEGHRRAQCPNPRRRQRARRTAGRPPSPRRDPTVTAWNMEARFLEERAREAHVALAVAREMSWYWDRRYAHHHANPPPPRPWFHWDEPPRDFEAVWGDLPRPVRNGWGARARAARYDPRR
jgi:hypothetical protein